MFLVQILKISWWNHFLFVWLRAAHSIVCLVVSIVRLHVSDRLYFFRFCCSLKIRYLFVSPEFLTTFAKFQCLLSNLFSRNALHLSYSPVIHEPVILQLLSYLPLCDCIFYKCHSSSHFSSRILLDLPVSSGTNALIFTDQPLYSMKLFLLVSVLFLN